MSRNRPLAEIALRTASLLLLTGGCHASAATSTPVQQVADFVAGYELQVIDLSVRITGASNEPLSRITILPHCSCLTETRITSSAQAMASAGPIILSARLPQVHTPTTLETLLTLICHSAGGQFQNNILVRGIVLPAISFEPRPPRFYSFTQFLPTNLSYTIRSATGEPLSLPAIEPSETYAWYQADTNTYSLVIALSNATAGIYHTAVSLKQGEREKTLDINYRVCHPLCDEPMIVGGLSPIAQKTQLTFRLKELTPKDITNISFQGTNLLFSWEAYESSNAAIVSLHYTSDQPGAAKGRLRIQVDHARYSVIDLPFFAEFGAWLTAPSGPAELMRPVPVTNKQ